MGLFKKEISNKVGRVKKCPQCGTSVPASKVVCPECGWEFDESNAGGALDRLHEEIKKSKGFFSGRSEKDVICSFPIPKTKADLLELTIFFKSKVKNVTIVKQVGEEKELLFAYKQKYDECIMKAKQFYSNDAEFKSLIEEYNKEKKAKVIWVVILSIVTIVLATLYFTLFHN